ncbi:MAG: hypothetical protein QGF67_05065 [Lentisphaeria bacterium]|jgi:5-methyltetrahydrofolate--homocysteine methyltransferase|nr:hypothetical protein [Lentisphaeria bacterium]MDP7740787.1 hypothetical protein [Lentisphaeria bacterium]
MRIDFDRQRWDRVKDNSRNWWAGELGRPLIQMRLHGADPGRPEPELPARHFTAQYGTAVSAEAIVDRWDYDLAGTVHLGDAFPVVWPNYGPGVLAAMIGAEPEVRDETVWFHPRAQVKIDDLSFAVDSSDPWLQRIRDINKAAAARWGDLVQVGMTDLGGAFDVLSTFRPGEQLLLDLYDHPGAVMRQIDALHAHWFAVFDLFNQDLQRFNPGYTAWTPIYSSTPYYMLQCDFAYMIGPDMFDRFVKPELTASCERLSNPFYHLDGPGQLPHLDSLLSIEALKGVQWVPGDGQPGITEWPEVYRKIRDAGKLIQVFSGQSEIGYKALDVLSDQLSDASPIIMIGETDIAAMDEVMAFLAAYGAA